jgi:predicted transcriptional regulator
MPIVGDIIKVKKISSGHNYQIGKKYRIVVDGGPVGFQADSVDDAHPVRGNWIKETDFDVLYIKKNVSEEIEKITFQLSSLKKKKEYLVKNELKDIDEKVFSILEIMEVSKSDKSEKEKVKEIQFLISNYNK